MNARQKRWAIGIAGLLSMGFGTPAFAQQHGPAELIDQQHCMFCHTAGSTFVAPSFHQIAERYRDQPQAALMLEQKLRRGGKAHWGNKPMPLPPDRGAALSPQDAHTLVQWVLSQ